MAGLPWFELDTDYHDSPKVEALKSRLRNQEADAFPSRLYAYCYKHAVDRFDPDVAAHTIEAAAKWRGRRGVLFDALFAVGVLERDGGKVVVHGVAERLAPHLAKRQGDAERQRRRRDRVATSVAGHAVVTPDVTRDEPRESRRNKDKDTYKEEIVPPTPPVPAVERPARVATMGVAHPAYESVTHWKTAVWPRLSSAACPDVTTVQAQSLGHLSGKHGVAAICAAMDTAAADEFWGSKLDLDTFIAKHARWLARKAGAAPPGKRPGMAPMGSAEAFAKDEKPW